MSLGLRVGAKPILQEEMEHSPCGPEPVRPQPGKPKNSFQRCQVHHDIPKDSQEYLMSCKLPAS